MHFSPEREFVEHAVKFSQCQIESKVKLVAYKGCAYVVGRSRDISNLYSADESSMHTLDMNWTPQDTSRFIAIQPIYIEKCGARKIKDGEPLARVQAQIWHVGKGFSTFKQLRKTQSSKPG